MAKNIQGAAPGAANSFLSSAVDTTSVNGEVVVLQAVQRVMLAINSEGELNDVGSGASIPVSLATLPTSQARKYTTDGESPTVNVAFANKYNGPINTFVSQDQPLPVGRYRIVQTLVAGQWHYDQLTPGMTFANSSIAATNRQVCIKALNDTDSSLLIEYGEIAFNQFVRRGYLELNAGAHDIVVFDAIPGGDTRVRLSDDLFAIGSGDLLLQIQAY